MLNTTSKIYFFQSSLVLELKSKALKPIYYSHYNLIFNNLHSFNILQEIMK